MHVAFVAFVVIGQVLILIGGLRGSAWIRRLWLRVLHLVAIGVVVAQTWLGVICPLTTLEMTLRRRAGDATYAGGFVAHWLHELLFFQAPAWVFAVVYTAFGGLVLASWVLWPPRRSR